MERDNVLTPVQKNIGATIVMMNTLGAMDINGADPAKVLFTVESTECDANTNGACRFTKEPFECSIDRCPLGALVQEEFLSAAAEIDTSSDCHMTEELLHTLMKG